MAKANLQHAQVCETIKKPQHLYMNGSAYCQNQTCITAVVPKAETPRRGGKLRSNITKLVQLWLRLPPPLLLPLLLIHRCRDTGGEEDDEDEDDDEDDDADANAAAAHDDDDVSKPCSLDPPQHKPCAPNCDDSASG